MTLLIDYFWPIAALGVVLGAIFGTLSFRRDKQSLLAIGAAIGIFGAVIWHGPLGAADRFSASIEPAARAVLVDWEVPQIEAKLHHGPLTRRVMLSGPADDFQRSQLVLIMESMPGVSSATWTDRSGLPLIVEATGVSLLGFLLGLGLAYLFELHRRHNAQWKW